MFKIIGIILMLLGGFFFIGNISQQSSLDYYEYYSEICLDDSDCSFGGTCTAGKCSNVYERIKDTLSTPNLLDEEGNLDEITRSSEKVETQLNDYWSYYVIENDLPYFEGKCRDGTQLGECNGKGYFCTSAGLIPDGETCGCPSGTELIQNTCVKWADDDSHVDKQDQTYMIFGAIAFILGLIMVMFL